MKRADLVKHLGAQGCTLLREGARHSVYVNRKTGKASTVPRHREINDFPAVHLYAGQHAGECTGQYAGQQAPGTRLSSAG